MKLTTPSALQVRRSRLRKLLKASTAFRHFTFWLTPKKENSIGYFWPGKDAGTSK